jgi:hypothetical protein
MCATALIERVIRHAGVIGIQGKSYRTREAEQDTQERAKRRPMSKPKPDSALSYNSSRSRRKTLKPSRTKGKTGASSRWK